MCLKQTLKFSLCIKENETCMKLIQSYIKCKMYMKTKYFQSSLISYYFEIKILDTKANVPVVFYDLQD